MEDERKNLNDELRRHPDEMRGLVEAADIQIGDRFENSGAEPKEIALAPELAERLWVWRAGEIGRVFDLPVVVDDDVRRLVEVR